VALTIAGSDSGGGAGVQADLKTFHAFGVFGTTAVTAVTVQNTRGVSGVHPIPVDTVAAQIDAVRDDLEPAAVKSGMLASTPLVEAVARALDRGGLGPYVLDPVMVATSGDRLLDEDAEEAVLALLLPRAALVTPNLHEAGILVGRPVGGVESMRNAARELVERGAGAALVKGGDGTGEEVVDLLWDGERERLWRRRRILRADTHGTGCTLSSAVAAGLALGHPLPEAVDRAVDFVVRAIQAAPGLGSGHGPVNHFVGTDRIPGLPHGPPAAPDPGHPGGS
jgi:hydroxymethylpyrimidine/phosphomethylpyrimidine kinase